MQRHVTFYYRSYMHIHVDWTAANWVLTICLNLVLIYFFIASIRLCHLGGDVVVPSSILVPKWRQSTVLFPVLRASKTRVFVTRTLLGPFRLQLCNNIALSLCLSEYTLTTHSRVVHVATVKRIYFTPTNSYLYTFERLLRSWVIFGCVKPLSECKSVRQRVHGE